MLLDSIPIKLELSCTKLNLITPLSILISIPFLIDVVLSELEIIGNVVSYFITVDITKSLLSLKYEFSFVPILI